MTVKDIVLAVVIPLALAEVGPWCGWLAARLLPWATRLRYGDTDRAAVRLAEWSGDLDEIPGQLTKLAYAVAQLAAGSAVSACRIARTFTRALRGRTTRVVGVRTETSLVRLSFGDREVDLTEEFKSMAARRGMSVKELIERREFFDGLADIVPAQLPMGEPIQIFFKLEVSPVMSGG